MLFTTSVLHSHAPRVTLLPPHTPDRLLDSPLVHKPTGRLSPLVLEHLHPLMSQGAGSLPTAALVVDLVALLARAPCEIGSGMERCVFNEEACWRAWQ